DSEQLEFEADFDGVIFFDSLHHSVDERAALGCAFRALRPGGICVTVEPGRGHQRRYRHVEAQFDVTEKDMPPRYVRRLGKSVGFERGRTYPAVHLLGRILYPSHAEGGRWPWKLLRLWPLRCFAALGILLAQSSYGIT